MLMQLPMAPASETDPNRMRLLKTPLVTEVIGSPVHLLTDRACSSRAGKRVVRHVWSCEMPIGSVEESPFGLSVTSPLFTLLTMAATHSVLQLAMAMYEMCGTFAVFEPSENIEELLHRERIAYCFSPGFGWRRMGDGAPRASALWERPSLVGLDELRNYAASISGMRGVKRFTQATGLVSGVTASPLEAQASMLLGFPRRLGGEGFSLQNNVELDLNREAKRLSGRNKRVGDIVITSDNGERCVVVECQGRAFHGSAEAKIADSDRTTALQSMGYEVILMTYAQLVDPLKFETVVKLIKRKLGMRNRAKSPVQEKATAKLRSELFRGWI